MQSGPFDSKIVKLFTIMPSVPPYTKTLRQMIVVGFFAFFVGMAGILIFVGWLMWRFVEPDTRWFDLLHIAVNALIWSVIGGLAFAAGATWLLSKWQCWRGMYRCPNCGRPRKGIGSLCDCVRFPGCSQSQIGHTRMLGI